MNASNASNAQPSGSFKALLGRLHTLRNLNGLHGSNVDLKAISKVAEIALAKGPTPSGAAATQGLGCPPGVSGRMVGEVRTNLSSSQGRPGLPVTKRRATGHRTPRHSARASATLQNGEAAKRGVFARAPHSAFCTEVSVLKSDASWDLSR